MGARDLLNDLSQAGLTIESDGSHLLIRPASLLTDELRSRVREAKPELLALLSEDPRTSALRKRLLRWGWLAIDAEALAQRLARRDREIDARVSCIDCRHYQPGRYGSDRCAARQFSEVGRDLAGMLQHCAAFTESAR